MRRYMLVDDNVAFAENVAEILTDAGATVTSAHDAASALEIVKRTRFDALVTDMKMPGGSGADLLREVRHTDPGLPVVLLSAYAANEQLAEVRRLGLFAFLSKTTNPRQLVQLLENAQRDRVVIAVTDDEAWVDQVREAVTPLGITVCGTAEDQPIAQLPPPLAVLAAPSGGCVERLKLVDSYFPGVARLPTTLSPGETARRLATMMSARA